MAKDEDNTSPAHPDLPPLRAIEEDGEKATQDLARVFVRETLRTGGRIDLGRLEQAGPAVQQAYQQMLARAAARTVAATDPARDRQETAEPKPPARSATPAAPDSKAPLPRATMNWADHRCAAPSFVTAARLRGLEVGIAAATVAIMTTFLLKL